MNIGYIVGAILVLLVGIWLSLAVVHIALHVLGWILIIAAAVALIKVLTSKPRGGRTTV